MLIYVAVLTKFVIRVVRIQSCRIIHFFFFLIALVITFFFTYVGISVFHNSVLFSTFCTT